MPWGIHAGKKMEDVPDRYLLFIYETKRVKSGPVYDYIVENLDVIKQVANGK